MISFIFSALIGVLSTIGLIVVLTLVWFIWRGDKEESELPRWYLKFSKWLQKKWDANMDRHERKNLLDRDDVIADRELVERRNS